MKFLKSLSVLVLAVFFLVACHSNRAKSQDTITVFDSDNQQVLQTSNTEALEWFDEILDEIDEADKSERGEGLAELPADAQVNYSYDVSRRKEGVSVRFTTYKNYPLVTISHIPAVPEITLELTDLEANDLNHPNNWIK
ncbi:hypothetical protein [Streptococcus massiliensis]|uniref:Lipoprotein n=1 Tax=Streptococcus massiliensis TaxID=313439 RepID=A0A380KX25_9STRE|nr:hypothetical protein [Streptococcus massiliensis]SUN76111.1 Uncharacterised protein [Streptococcus massiliensis]